MKRYWKEIMLGILIIVLLCIVSLHFYHNIQDEKFASQTNLYSLIIKDPKVVLSINRPQSFSRMLLSQPSIQEQFTSCLSDVYLTIAKRVNNPVLLSFHKEGVILYMKGSHLSIQSLEKELLSSHFNAYPPLYEKKEKTVYNYYPTIDHNFYASFYYKGIWVFGNNQKLLDRVVNQLTGEATVVSSDMEKAIALFDLNAPVNIAFPSNVFDIAIALNDSTNWHLDDDWLTADLFIGEGSVCSYSNFPFTATTDSLIFTTVKESLYQQIDSIFPQLSLSPQISLENESVAITICH